MTEFVRRLRGAIGTAMTWAIGWAILAFAGASTAYLFTGDRVHFWGTVFPLSLLAGLSGLIGGMVFSLALGVAYRHRRLGDLSALRMAVWGAGAAVLVPLGVLGAGMVAQVPMESGVVLAAILGLGALGGATAGGTIKLAQLADRRRGTPGSSARGR